MSFLQVVYLHATDQRTHLSDERSASLIGYASDQEASIATSFKLTLPSVFIGKVTEAIAVSLKTARRFPSFVAWDTQFSASSIHSGMSEKVRSMKSSYVARITGSCVSGEVKLVAQTLHATSVAFVDAGSAFLSSLYTSELSRN